MASQLEELTAEIRRLCTDKGWREGVETAPREGHAFPAYVALAHCELSEALEAYRDKIWSEVQKPCEHYKTFKSCSHFHKPIGVGPELADTLIRVLDMFDIWGLDPEYEINRVLEYGWTRPYKHGGRQL